MTKKIIIAISLLVLLAGGFYFFNKSRNTIPDSSLSIINPSDVVVSPDSIDIGKVLMKDGLITKEYEIKNNSDTILRLKKIATSCMCTSAKVEVGDKRTRFYSMEMNGDLNPKINFDIPGGGTAKITVRFDPAAHGLQGVGQVDRSVFLTFVDPVGTREIRFFGEVALQ